MKKKLVYLFGPLLFLSAQIVLPQGTVSAIERVKIISENYSSWIPGHGLILLSFPLLAIYFSRLFEISRLVKRATAFSGLLLMMIALFADSGIAAIQIISALLVSTNKVSVAEQLLNSFNTELIQMLFYFPYLFLVPGTILLSFPIFKINGYKTLSLSLVAFGLMAVTGGILQNKFILIASALSLLYSAFLFSREKQINYI